jgi:hypothetical protein
MRGSWLQREPYNDQEQKKSEKHNILATLHNVLFLILDNKRDHCSLGLLHHCGLSALRQSRPKVIVKGSNPPFEQMHILFRFYFFCLLSWRSCETNNITISHICSVMHS